MKIYVTVLLTIAAFSASVFGQTKRVESMCDVSAYIVDKDPNGLNVRSEPSGRSKKLGSIPFDKDGTMVSIIASSAKWVKIKSAWDMEEKTVFVKSGWVYAPLIAISIAQGHSDTQFVNAYEAPSIDNDVVAKLPVFEEFKLTACFEGWIKVTIPKPEGSVEGWVPNEDQCDLAQTKC